MALASPLRLAALAAVSGFMILAIEASVDAGPLPVARLGSINVIKPATFWGRPFPYGYAYTRRQLACWVSRRVDTPAGPTWERVWDCGNVVVSRY